jgi:hypothetical protein
LERMLCWLTWILVFMIIPIRGFSSFPYTEVFLVSHVIVSI